MKTNKMVQELLDKKDEEHILSMKKFKDELENIKLKHSNELAETEKLKKEHDLAVEMVSSIQHDANSEINVLTKEITTGINTINSNVSNQTAYQEEISASIGILSEDLTAMAKTIENSYQDAIKDSEAMQESDKSISDINDKVEKLNEFMENISLVLQTINEISEQTKLLSLNAQIEAAHAGESGKGFAVVANEVKSLSEQTKASSKDIEKIIKEAINQAKDILESTNVAAQNSKVLVENNITRMDNIGLLKESVDRIETSAHEINAGAQQSNSNMEEITNKTEDICNNEYIKQVTPILHIGNKVSKDGGAAKYKTGSYAIKYGGGKALLTFFGFLTGETTFREDYLKLKKIVVPEQTELILDASKLGIFASSFEDRTAAMYKEYACFNKIHVVVGDNTLIRTQLTNMFKKLNLLNKYDFVKYYDTLPEDTVD